MQPLRAKPPFTNQRDEGMSPLRAWQREIDVQEDQAARAADQRNATNGVTVVRPSPIHLARVVATLLDTSAFATIGDATKAVERLVTEHAGRPLTTIELSRIDLEVGVQMRAMANARAARDARPGIGGIDLVQLGRDVLSGAVGDHSMGSVTTRDGLVAVMVAQLEARMGRDVTGAETATIDFAASLARTQLHDERVASARETAERLHDPLMRIRRMG